MPDELFSFTQEQKGNLQRWKAFLDTDEAKWTIAAKESINSIHAILEQSGFEKGNDLPAEQLDKIFHNMRDIILNQALTRNLYDKNGIVKFNSRLRKLYFGNEPSAERINQFIELRGIGIITVSQFLCTLDPNKYPVITPQTLEVLELDSTQLDNAHKQALKEHNITSIENYIENTIEYLGEAVIFREIKNLLNLESYLHVNAILWLARGSMESRPEPITTSVSLEVDLRNHLADNPSLIENGLSLVGKEYSISGAGIADLLCKDKRGNYVIIETKKGRESDKVVGQILRYVGGLKKEGKKARGIIIVNEPDNKLDFAIEAVKDFIKLKYYKVRFEIADNFTDTQDKVEN